MHRHLAMMSLIAMTGAALPAAAQSKDDVAEQLKQLNERARDRYKAADYEGAIALFQEAYALEPVPNLLFNIAKCHEKMRQWEEAISYYEQFIVAPEVDSETRQTVLQQIKQLREVQRIELAERDAASGASDGQQDVVKPPAEPAPEGPNHTLAYTLMGTGGALVIGGAVFGLLAMGQQSTFDSATTLNDRRAARDSGQTYALIADIGYGVGVVAAGIGLVLWLTGGEAEAQVASPQGDDKARTGAAVQPWVMPGEGGGVQLNWSF